MSRMSDLDLTRESARCGNCGRTAEKSRIPVTTIVIDWRTELLCDTCVASRDWTGWGFDPILNIYLYRNSPN